MQNKTEIIAEEGKQEIIIKREFDLPLEFLFKAFENVEIFEQWMGTKVIKMNNSKHGSFAFETSTNGKVVFRANGTIHDFIPNQRIIRTFEMENTSIGVQLEFLEFEKLTDDRSKLTMQIIFKSVEHRAMQLKKPFAYGINMAHNRIQEIFNNLKGIL